MSRPPAFACLLALLLAAGAARATDESPVLHAQALLAESEDKIAEALALLRKAAQLAPSDAEVAFDLARLAYENPELGRDEDLAGFMAMEPASDDARLLRTYVLLRRGERQAAERELALVSADLSEGQTLRQAMSAEAGSAGTERAVRGVVHLGGQYDTNVTVVPDATDSLSGAADVDDAGPLNGARAFANVEAVWTPVRGDKVLDVMLALGFSRHLNDTDNLSTYDSASVEGGARLTRPGEAWDLYGDLSLLHVRSEGVESAFMSEALLTAGALHHLSRELDVGGYVRGGYRHFDLTEGRTGPRTEIAASLDWQRGGIAAGGRLGFQAELAEADQGQRELGPMALAYVRAARGGLNALLAVAYQMRAYSDVERTDQRVAPQLRVGYDVNEVVGLSGSYLFISNASEPAFEYRRHLAQLGVEARW